MRTSWIPFADWLGKQIEGWPAGSHITGVRIKNPNDIPGTKLEIHTTAFADTDILGLHSAVRAAHMHNVDCAEIYRTLRSHFVQLIHNVLAEELHLPNRRSPSYASNGAYYREHHQITHGLLGGKTIYLRFVPEKNITAQQMYLCQKALGPLVEGNAVQFIMDHDLIHHFEHVSPSPDYIEERLRVYAPHAQLTLADDE